MFAVCGRVWGGFGGLSFCCVWESLGRFWGIEFLLCVGEFGAGLGECVCSVCGAVFCGIVGVSVCCVWDSLERVWR